MVCFCCLPWHKGRDIDVASYIEGHHVVQSYVGVNKANSTHSVKSLLTIFFILTEVMKK